MNLARPWKIDHANAQSKGAHRHDQNQRCNQSDEKSKQACGHATSNLKQAVPAHSGADDHPLASCRVWAPGSQVKKTDGCPTQLQHHTAILVSRQS
jgi:hypothetical protein